CTPNHLTFTSQPVGTVHGSSIGSVGVGIYDSGDNLCSSATNTVTFSNHMGTCSGMSLTGTTSGAATAGGFSSSDMTESAAGACSLDANASGLTGATSNSFTMTDPVVVVPAAASSTASHRRRR